MFGSPTSGGVPVALPNAALPNSTSASKQYNSLFGKGGTGSAWAFAALIVLYVVWALVQQHQRLREQIQPKNIALNFHNLFAVALQVVVALGLIKLVLALANKFRLPGAQPVADAVEFAS